MTEATVGHNGGPPLEEPRRPRKLTMRTQWAKALFADRRTPSYVIAMSWAIHWYSQDDGSGAALSNEQFETMCGVPDRTVSRGKKWLYDHGYVTLRVGRSGQKTRFQMCIPDDLPHVLQMQELAANAADPEDKQDAMEADTGRHCGVIQPATVAALENSIRHGGGIAKTQDATVAASGEEIRQTGDVNPPERRTAGRQGGDLILESNQERKQEEEVRACAPTIEEKIEVKSPHKPEAKSGASFWKAALAPKEPEPHEDVLFRNGEVVLLNGARVEWLGQFQGEEKILDLALMEIAGEIQPNSSTPIKVQVVRKLAQITRRRLEQDKRYAAAAASKGGKSSNRTEDAAARRERIRQHAIEAAEAFERNRGRS